MLCHRRLRLASPLEPYFKPCCPVLVFFFSPASSSSPLGDGLQGFVSPLSDPHRRPTVFPDSPERRRPALATVHFRRLCLRSCTLLVSADRRLDGLPSPFAKLSSPLGIGLLLFVYGPSVHRPEQRRREAERDRAERRQGRSEMGRGGSGGGGGATAAAAASGMSEAVLRKVLLSYAYVGIWIFLSFTVIMLKALMPVAVYSISVLLKKETFKTQSFANMVSISVGVGIAAYGEARFDSWGVLLQLAAVAFEATRLVLIQILLTSKGINLNPITSLYYVAPCCFVFLSVPWLLVELPVLRETSSFRPDLFIFGTNSLCAFALNLAVFLLVGKTSALTMNVAGVVKDWLLIAFSWSVIRDTVTAVNLVGYGIAFLGVAYYNHVKLQALKSKEAQKKSAQQPDDEEARLLEGKMEGGAGEMELGKKSDVRA
ncbi:hypothetical protein Taro_037545 [Colocasia esculenta]|uniref:Sugar phosphate transporter domain-containing protein n=1 Tax=Colocasia esculenta TaxID=4460 RepID=A0A843WJL5_COLES|nr:hypothetical protein [Colocasia esculenta]